MNLINKLIVSRAMKACLNVYVWTGMAVSGLGVCVSAVCGARTIVKDKILRVPDTCTILELLRKVADERAEIDTRDDTSVTVQCSKKSCGGWMDAELTSDVGLLVSDFGCRYIRFTVPIHEPCPEEPSNKHARTVSDVLMGEAQTRDKLPKPKHVTNKKAELFNAVRGLLVTRKIGFHSSTADSEGFYTINALTNVLWSIDANQDSLLQATTKRRNTKVPKLPEVWLQFRGYNDYKAKKIAKPRLSEDLLKCSAQQLFNLAGRASLASPAWQQTRLEIEGLANTLSGYATCLSEANTAQQERQSRAHPPRQVYMSYSDFVCPTFSLSLCVCVCVCVCAYYLVLWISVHFEHCSAAIRLLHQQLAFVQLVKVTSRGEGGLVIYTPRAKPEV